MYTTNGSTYVSNVSLLNVIERIGALQQFKNCQIR